MILYIIRIFKQINCNSGFSEKFWFCRLSLNHKVLHYGDLDESPQGEVPFEMLTDKSERSKKLIFHIHFWNKRFL